MNILLTCAGRRNYLVEYFRQALLGRGSVFAADADGRAPALREADRGFVVGYVDDGRYCEQLLELCRQHDVRLLVPLADPELSILAAHRDEFLALGTIPVVSSPDVVRTCADKWATSKFLAAGGLGRPKTYLSLGDARAALSRGDVRFPLIVKPRWGTASVGVETAEDDIELEAVYRLTRKRVPRLVCCGAGTDAADHTVLIQELLRGSEYGLDVVNDLSGRYVTTLIRLKCSMRAGETNQAVTVADPELEALGETLGRRLGHVGNLDCEVFVNEAGCRVLEMNPRFGGGYPFSHVAGANLPAALIAWAAGELPDPSWLAPRANVASAKCDRLVVVKDEKAAPSRLMAATPLAVSLATMLCP